MIEIIVVISIGAILVSMALRGFGDASSSMAVQSARRDLSAMQARARARAIERGDMVRLHVDPVGDSAWIEGPSGRVDIVNFAESRNVDIQSGAGGLITLCMNPRGFAETSCNTFGSGTVDLDFVQGGQSAGVTILPLGQVKW